MYRNFIFILYGLCGWSKLVPTFIKIQKDTIGIRGNDIHPTKNSFCFLFCNFSVHNAPIILISTREKHAKRSVTIDHVIFTRRANISEYNRELSQHSKSSCHFILGWNWLKMTENSISRFGTTSKKEHRSRKQFSASKHKVLYKVLILIVRPSVLGL